MIRLNARRSIIWKLPEQEFRDLVASYNSYTEILKFFGFENKGRNAITLQKRIKELSIDVSHIIRGKGRQKSRPFHSHDDVFREDSIASRSCARKRILKYNLLPYVCQLCPQDDVWNGKPLVLVLDHINGKPKDHRLSNLRFLCPNCNSQTDTFAGKNR